MTVIRDRKDPHGSPIPEINARPTLLKVTDAERALATQHIVRVARDENDCTQLLSMLGLDVP